MSIFWAFVNGLWVVLLPSVWVSERRILILVSPNNDLESNANVYGCLLLCCPFEHEFVTHSQIKQFLISFHAINSNGMNLLIDIKRGLTRHSVCQCRKHKLALNINRNRKTCVGRPA